MKALTLIAAVSLGLSSLAQANLITNGGFENPDINNGWTYENGLPGWEGDNIEVWQTGFNGVVSYNGSDQHGELNSHPSSPDGFSIFQSFATLEDAEYELTFAYRARRSTNEAFQVELFTGSNDYGFTDNALAHGTFNAITEESGDYGFNLVMDDHTTSDWSLFTYNFLGTGEDTTLRFTSLIPDTGTVGNFLDEVSVTGGIDTTRTNVPEPGSIALLAMGLIGLGVSRRNLRR